MAGVPFDWNVIVTGAWNPSILTAKGISQLCYKLEDDEPLLVHVPVNQPGPISVKHGALAFEPSRNRIVVSALANNKTGIVKAAGVSVNAVSGLHMTPFSAAGVNVRYRFPEIPEELVSYLESPVDSKIAGFGLQRAGSFFRRNLVWQEGLLNLSVDHPEQAGGAVVLANFHKGSRDGKILIEWLQKAETMVDAALDLFCNCLGLDVGAGDE